jgi:predicted CoA-binding protein
VSERFVNPDAREIRDLLVRVRNIAVVGLSPKPARPSHSVAAALQEFGYRVLPVRPAVERILGEPVYRNLGDVPERIDLVNVFRASAHVKAVVERCIELSLPALWLQDGIVDEAAALRAREAGIFVVMDRCIYRDHRALIGSTGP